MNLQRLATRLRQSAREPGNKRLGTQLLDILLLYLRTGLGPAFYYLGRMDARGVPRGEVLAYASVGAYNRAVRRVNDTGYYRASQHKAIEKAILSTYGIPTPELLAYVEPAGGRSVRGAPARSADDVVAVLAGLEEGARVCCKQANSWGGLGFRAFAVTAAGTALRDLASGEVLDTRRCIAGVLADSPQGIVIERYLEQHSFYRAVNPSSVNSFRIFIWDRQGAPRPWLLAFLRAGRAGAIVDNTTAGAIVFPVDPESRRLGRGVEKYGGAENHRVHPESGVELAGIAPPLFDDAVALALEAVRVFPGVHFAGVDIAMSVRGPVVLELNVWPDYSGFAYCRCPFGREFVDRV